MAAQPTALRASRARPGGRVRSVEAPPRERAPAPARDRAAPRDRVALRDRVTSRDAPAVAVDPVAAGHSELARVLRWTLGVPTAALVSAVALYVLGAIWTWGEIQDAGLIPTDVLSLVPHSQILGRGLQIVILAVLALPLPLAFTWLLHRVLPDRGRPWGIPGALARLLDDHRRLRRDLDELRGEADPITAPGLDRRVRRLNIRANGQRGAQRRAAWMSRATIAAAVAIGLFALSPARLAVAIFGLWLVRRTRLSTWRVVLVVFGALILAISAERFTAPDPLPDASVRTTRGILIKGPLVAATQQSWHVKIADRRVKSIPTVNIAKSSVYSESRLVRGPLGARLADLLR